MQSKIPWIQHGRGRKVMVSIYKKKIDQKKVKFLLIIIIINVIEKKSEHATRDTIPFRQEKRAHSCSFTTEHTLFPSVTHLSLSCASCLLILRTHPSFSSSITFAPRFPLSLSLALSLFSSSPSEIRRTAPPLEEVPVSGGVLGLGFLRDVGCFRHWWI